MDQEKQSQQFQNDFLNSVKAEAQNGSIIKEEKKNKSKKSLYIGAAVLAVALICLAIILIINNGQNQTSSQSVLSCRSESSSLEINYDEKQIISINITGFLPLDEEDERTSAVINGVDYTIDKIKTWFESSALNATCEIK